MGFVQGASSSSSTSVVSVAFASSNILGNCLIVIAEVVEPFGGLAGMTISDTQGNTWTPLPSTPTELNAVLPGVWICASCKAGANTVTVTYGYGTQNIAASVVEFSGLGSLDVQAVNSDTSVLSVTTSVTTTVDGEILIGLGLSKGTGATGWANSSGFTSDLSVGEFAGMSYAMGFGVFSQIAGAAGVYSLTAGLTITSDQYLYLLAFTGSGGVPVRRNTQRGNIAFDQIRGSDRTGDGNQLITWSTAPATNGDPGNAGQVAYDASGNFYWCYAPNSWARYGPAGYSSTF